MTPDLRPRALGDAAEALDLDVFELVRLMVASGEQPEGLAPTGVHLARLSQFGGLARWWRADAYLPEDTHPTRARVRAAVGRLLADADADTPGTRRDNLWRGLPDDERDVMARAVARMVDAGLLKATPHVRGVRLIVPPSAIETLTAFASEGVTPEPLQRLWP